MLGFPISKQKFSFLYSKSWLLKDSWRKKLCRKQRKMGLEGAKFSRKVQEEGGGDKGRKAKFFTSLPYPSNSQIHLSTERASYCGLYFRSYPSKLPRAYLQLHRHIPCMCFPTHQPTSHSIPALPLPSPQTCLTLVCLY